MCFCGFLFDTIIIVVYLFIPFKNYRQFPIISPKSPINSAHNIFAYIPYFVKKKQMELYEIALQSVCLCPRLILSFGRATAQAVSRRLPTAAARVQTRV
jgi:hypothetical protein